mgnify:CR=1 FL=1
MVDLPKHWGAYLRLQDELSRRSRLDDVTWGYEDGLNRLLDSIFDGDQLSQIEIDRARAAGERRNRHQARLRALHISTEEPNDPRADLIAVETRQTLDHVKNSVTNTDWELLCYVAAGYEYAKLAVHRQTSEGNLRARVLRLRQSLLSRAA